MRAVALLALGLLLACTPPRPVPIRASTLVNKQADCVSGGWYLTWSDEFNSFDGSHVDPGKWSYDVGGFGWGNQELEYYTQGLTNIEIRDQALAITARTNTDATYQCTYAPSSPGTCLYTSGRIRTQYLFAQAYGRFEARIKIPVGVGVWPAFWMVGANYPDAGSPTSGEIDILENRGDQPGTNYGGIHFIDSRVAGPAQDFSMATAYTLPNGQRLGDDFHTYGIEWTPSVVTFFVDGNPYSTVTPPALFARYWVYDHPMFLLLNFAVGGTYGGNPDATTQFPQTMKVDWVRVYAKCGS